MADFSIQDVAFTGFGVVRQHPRALVAWWLYALAFSLLVGLVFIGLGGAALMRFLEISRQPNPDPGLVLPLVTRLLPANLSVMAIALISQAILSAAMIRAVLRPRDERLGFLRLGADELRQFGLCLLALLVLAGVYIAMVLIVTVAVGLVDAAAGHTTAGAVLVVLLLVMSGVILVLAVRLSLAPALTFDTARINLFGSWTLTRGRFWPLFGAYFLTAALVVVVCFLSLLLISAIGAILNGGDLASGWKAADMGSLKGYFSPARLALTVLNAGVSALVWPILFTPPVAVYRVLSPAAAAGDAFA